MVGGSPQNLEAVTGPFGRGGYSLRTVAPDLRAEQVAGVSTAGGTLWVAPVKDTGEQPTTLIRTGEDLLRPAWDFSGRLWEVDRRKTGAVVYYLRTGPDAHARGRRASAVRTSRTSSCPATAPG